MPAHNLTKKEKALLESIAGTGKYNLPDADADGVPDVLDCAPFDPNKDGIFGDIYKSVFSRTSAAAQIARQRIYRPAAVSGREAVSTVYRRAYGAGAAARAAVSSRVRRAKEFAKAPPADRARRIEAGKEAFIKARKPDRPMSDISLRIHKETARVAGVVRGFEGRVDPYISKLEPIAARTSYPYGTPPPATKWGIKQAKELGYGVAFRAPAAAVEMVGMLPGAGETIYHKPRIIPAAATVGTYMMGKSLFRGITTEPGATAGELIGLGAITRGARVPTAVSRRAKLPSVISRDVKLPDIREIIGKDVKPEGFKALSPAKQIKYEAGVKVLKALYKTKGTQRKPLDFTEVKALPGESGLIVERWIKAHPEQKPVMAGSAVPRTQIKGTRIPGDVDVHVVDRVLAAKQLYAELKPILKENVRIDKKGTGIETRTPGGKWTHAVDLQPAFEGLELIVPGLAWSVRPKPITIGGIKYATIGEQLMRKASQTLQVRTPDVKKLETLSWEVVGGKKVFRKDIELGPGMEEHVVRPGDPTLGPFAHRAHKDVYDFMDIGDQVLAGRMASAESAWLLKGYRMKKEMATGAAMETYKAHGYMYPDPYPAYRAYRGLPTSVKLPSYLIAAYTAGARDYPTPKYPKTPDYPVAKYQTPKYPPPHTPTRKKYPTPPPYTPDYPKTPVYPKTPDYPKTPPPPDTPMYPPPPPPPPMYTHYTTKKMYKLTKDKKKRKIKAKKAKQKVAVGWKQRHKLVTLESLFGTPPGMK